MRITGLKLENFRGFESLDMDFHPNLTVLVGVNGSGKTSILDAVAALLGNAIQQGYSVTKRDLRLGSKKAVINLLSKIHDTAEEANEKLLIQQGRVSLINEGKKLSLMELDLINGPLPICCYFRVNRHAVDATPGSTNPLEWNARSAWDHALIAPNRSFQIFFNGLESVKIWKTKNTVKTPVILIPN